MLVAPQVWPIPERVPEGPGEERAWRMGAGLDTGLDDKSDAGLTNGLGGWLTDNRGRRPAPVLQLPLIGPPGHANPPPHADTDRSHASGNRPNRRHD